MKPVAAVADSLPPLTVHRFSLTDTHGQTPSHTHTRAQIFTHCHMEEIRAHFPANILARAHVFCPSPTDTDIYTRRPVKR